MVPAKWICATHAVEVTIMIPLFILGRHQTYAVIGLSIYTLLQILTMGYLII